MTHFVKFRAGLLTATMLVGAVLGAPAMAQEQTAEAVPVEPEGGDIIVTGLRRSSTIQDTPINIAAIGAEQLASERLDDIRDLGAFTPGITVTDTGPRGAGTIVMRGLSADDSSSFGNNTDSAIGTYLGEVPLYLDFKLIDLQRVEVLLGPQGTLYGLGTLAGAIRYIPERPDPTRVSGYAHGRVFDVAHGKGVGFSADGAFNLPIIPDILAFRSASGYYYDPGFIDYPFIVAQPGVSLPQPGPVSNPAGTPAQRAENFAGQEDVNFERTVTTRNQLGLTLDNLKAYLTYAYQRTETDGRQANGGGVLGEGRYQGPWRSLEPSRRDAHLVSLEVEAELGEIAQLVSATAYTETTNRSSVDVTDLLIDLDYDYELFPAFTGFTQQRAKNKQFNQELRLVSTHGGPFSWVLGGFYNNFKTNTSYREIVPGFSQYTQTEEGMDTYGYYDFLKEDNVEYASFGRSETTEKAIFGEASFKIVPEWQVTGGLRYFKYDVTRIGGSTLPLFDPGPEIVIPSSTGDASKDGFVWKFNSSINITPNLLLWGTYSKGYRIGGANTGAAPCILPLDPTKQNICALPNELFFGPDETKNAEIGIRGQFLDGRVSMSLSVFNIDWDGIQLAGQTVNGSIGITANGGTARSRGFDYTFNARVSDRFTLRGNFSYLDAKLTQDVPELLSVQGGDLVGVFAGDRLPGSAALTGALSGTYVLPIGENELALNWTTTYTGDILSRTGNRGGGETIPEYSMSRASMTYSMGAYEISAFVNNIFDKYAITGISNDLTRRNFVNDGVISRFYARGVAQPRVLGLEARVKF